MANIITCIRIALSFTLLLLPVLSPAFLFVYIAAGVMLFLFPLTLLLIDLKYSAVVVCAVATVAAVHEGYLINQKG